MVPSFVGDAGQGGAHAGHVECPFLVERLWQPVRAAVHRGTVRVSAVCSTRIGTTLAALHDAVRAP
eukprot:8652139-Pyramimonas_sp.AAC.1